MTQQIRQCIELAYRQQNKNEMTQRQSSQYHQWPVHKITATSQSELLLLLKNHCKLKQLETTSKAVLEVKERRAIVSAII